MQSSNSPTKIPVPFANSGTKNTIPVPSQIGVTPGAASFTTGFPPLTFTPIAAGGVPPFGADFNGVFNAITQALRWANGGGHYTYDSAFATSVGGYPKGALLQRATLDGFWLNTTENNSTDPDASGAGWVDPLSGRLINVQNFTSSGTYTPTAGTKSVVIEVQAGGGAGGGVATTSTGQAAIGGGGGAGGYAKSRLSSGFSGVSIVVGAGGSGAVNTAGGNGGSSSFGALITCTGGGGGAAGAVTSTSTGVGSGAGGVATGGNIVNLTGPIGTGGMVINNAGIGSGVQSLGGQCQFGSATSSGNANGNGSGGTGAVNFASAAARAGGNGAPGIVIVWEFS